ncbi:MAG: quinoprotein dehydrogenase-associated SoxYZ-like carrier [Methylococcales bacterium]|jgi:sulfur-oxidizing protein SoxY|nr:quinoprotein dehydrogenase-associated SoxYZ-like carrier [Methylococcaceae bacterium]HIL40935.1 quinoprotein dehydrogenase-associated SoxYZ-like carrier [Methylococcales bacterium]
MKIVSVILSLCLVSFINVVSAGVDESVWQNQLKGQFFSGRAISEAENIIAIEAPYRAEDAALVPIRVTSKINQTNEKYIKKITLIVDKNPIPFAAEFNFTPLSGKADVALRLRVNSYSYVRAIAEMNDGQLFMVKKFVKASGGCSAPIGADLDAAMQRLGRMKFKFPSRAQPNEPNLAQLLISHPNITGMQMDQVSRFIRPAYYVEKVKVTFDGQPVLTAKTDIAISADPNFRFYFVPQSAGELRAEAIDTDGKVFSQTYQVKP